MFVPFMLGTCTGRLQSTTRHPYYTHPNSKENPVIFLLIPNFWFLGFAFQVTVFPSLFPTQSEKNISTKFRRKRKEKGHRLNIVLYWPFAPGGFLETPETFLVSNLVISNFTVGMRCFRVGLIGCTIHLFVFFTLQIGSESQYLFRICFMIIILFD